MVQSLRRCLRFRPVAAIGAGITMCRAPHPVLDDRIRLNALPIIRLAGGA
jgi:hypothetical protein